MPGPELRERPSMPASFTVPPTRRPPAGVGMVRRLRGRGDGVRRRAVGVDGVSARGPLGREGRPVRGEKLASQVARQIVRDIVEHDLRPGAALAPETEMLQRFGVSRATLRESLRILEIQGLLTIRPGPGGGPSVAEVDSRDFGRTATLYFQVMRVDLGSVMEARLALEPMMAEQAAAAGDDELRQRLRDSIERHDVSLPREAWQQVTDEFHGLICGMSGNPLLDLLARSLKNIYGDRVSGLVFPEDKRDDVRRTHERIATAIDAGDAATAGRLMSEHMRAFADYFAATHPGLMEEVVDWR